MKRLVIAVTLFALSLSATPLFAQGDEPERPCYECRSSGEGYMDCWTGANPGHVSCIPYATTCSVGAGCGTSFRTLRLSPDGSFMSPSLLLPGIVVASLPGLSRNCVGIVDARSYTTIEASAIRAGTSHFVL